MKNILILLLVVFLVSCGNSHEYKPDKDIYKDTGNKYTVSRETSLYSELSASADQIAVLSAGTKVIPADGKNSLTCKSFTEEEMFFTLCKVEVVSSGKIGWILKKALSE